MYGLIYFSQLMVVIGYKLVEVDIVQVWLGLKAMISNVFIWFKLTWIPSSSFPTRHTLSQTYKKYNKSTLKYIMHMCIMYNMFVPKNDKEVVVYSSKS